MNSLDVDLDLSAQIDKLPKHKGYSVLPPRSGEQYITCHYSGVDYPPTDRAGELQRVLNEAAYQLHHNYGTGAEPAYPDGLLYDVVILSDGWVVRTRARRQQLWHAGNGTANARSWAVHLMLGPTQDATPAQWAKTIQVFAALGVDYGIPHGNVVGHCEWPRTTGLAQPSAMYHPLPGQSECPGRFLHQRLASWRLLPDTPTIPDPLKAERLPGPKGTTFACSKETAGFYALNKGAALFGLVLRDEQRAVGMDGRLCSFVECERVVIKTAQPEGTHLALLDEAQSKGWT